MSPLEKLNKETNRKADALRWEQRIRDYVEQQKAMGLLSERPGLAYETEYPARGFENTPDAPELDGSDTSMSAQLDEAGFGSAGIM